MGLVPLQLFGSSDNTLGLVINMLYFVFFFFIIFYGNALQVWRMTKQIEQALFKLDRMSVESKEILTKSVKDVGKPSEDPSKAVAGMLEFVTIEPVSLDPAGVIQRLDHILDVRKSSYEDAVARMAPAASKDEASNLEGSIEAASAVYFIFKVIRHYYLLARKRRT